MVECLDIKQHSKILHGKHIIDSTRVLKQIMECTEGLFKSVSAYDTCLIGLQCFSLILSLTKIHDTISYFQRS